MIAFKNPTKNNSVFLELTPSELQYLYSYMMDLTNPDKVRFPCNFHRAFKFASFIRQIEKYYEQERINHNRH